MNRFTFFMITMLCVSNLVNGAWLKILSVEDEKKIKEVVVFGTQDKDILVNKGLKKLSPGAVEMFGVMPPQALEEIGAEEILERSTDVYQPLVVQVNIPTAKADCLRYRVRNRDDIRSLICLVKQNLHVDGALHEVKSIDWMFITQTGAPSDQAPVVIIDHDATLESLRARAALHVQQ